jgi:membrane protease YdiL (CAAX protease family)
MQRTTDNGQRTTDNWLAILFALCFPTVVTLVYFVLLAGLPSAWQEGAYGAGKLIQFLFPVVWVVIIRRERPRLHLPRARDIALGGALGLVFFAATLSLYHLLKSTSVLVGLAGEVQAKIEGLGMNSAPRFLLLASFYAIFHSGLEEYYWRWFVFGRLRRRTPFSGALVISSLGFMAHHVCILSVFFGWSTAAGIALTIVASAAVAVGGMIWAWLYDRTGSIYAPWVSHGLMDAAIFFVGYQMRA